MFILAYALFLGPAGWPVSVLLAYAMTTEAALEAAGLWLTALVGTAFRVRRSR